MKLIQRILLVVLMQCSAHAAVLSVCASGCPYNSFSAAQTAAHSGDVIELKAGETFNVSSQPLRKDISNIWVRSSKYRDLPPVGVRSGAANVSAMATLSTPDSNPILFTGQPVCNFSWGENSRTVNCANGNTMPVAGDRISITNSVHFSGYFNLPAAYGINGWTDYYACNISGFTFQLCLSRGGGLGVTSSPHVQYSMGTQLQGVSVTSTTGQDGRIVTMKLNFTHQAELNQSAHIIISGASTPNMNGDYVVTYVESPTVFWVCKGGAWCLSGSMAADGQYSAVTDPNMTVDLNCAAEPCGVVGGYFDGLYYSDPPHDWKFTGIEFTCSTCGSGLLSLLQFDGSALNNVANYPYNFEFDRVYIHGKAPSASPSSDGPGKCMQASVRALWIHDSTISDCHSTQTGDANAIYLGSNPGPVTVENSYLSASGEIVIIGSQYDCSFDGGVFNTCQAGKYGGLRFINNYWHKPWSWNITGQAGPPSGTCYWDAVGGGQFNKDSVSNVVRQCNSSLNWASATVVGTFTAGTEPYKQYVTKNFLEVKSGTNLVAQGNIFANAWSYAQQGWCYTVIHYDPGLIDNHTFRDNICTDLVAGFNLATESPGAKLGGGVKRINIRNNLLKNFREDGFQNSRGLAFTAVDYLSFEHNTVLYNVLKGYQNGFLQRSDILANTFLSARWANNISTLETYQLSANIDQVGGENCNAFQSVSPGFAFLNQTWVGLADTLFTTCSTGTTNPADLATLFVNPTTGDWHVKDARSERAGATDGKDVGADVDQINTITMGVTGGARYRDIFKGVSAGSNIAIFNLRTAVAPVVTVYSSPARTAASQVASVSGCTTSAGSSCQVVVPGLSPGTTYYWKISAGGQTIFDLAETALRTLGSGSGQYAFQFSGATVRYSSSPSMTGATVASAGVVPVPSATVRYVDRGSGTPVEAVAAP
jgi:hypothetical protein